MEENRVAEKRFEAEVRVILRVGDSVRHTLTSFSALGDGLRDDADVGDAGLAKRVDDAGKSAEGNGFVATEKDGVVGMLELLFNFVGEVVDVDGVVAEIDALVLVEGDDEALLGDFFDGVGFGDVDFDAGLKDGGGDHKNDEENEDDVDERHHVDVGEGGLR